MTIWSKKNGHWKQVSGTSQADKSAIWGRISGSIRSQTDLIDILDTLQRDLNNVRAEYLDKFNLNEVQLVRSRTDFEREPLIRTVAPGDVNKDDGRHAVNYATMKRDAMMLFGEQRVSGKKIFLDSCEYRANDIGNKIGLYNVNAINFGMRCIVGGFQFANAKSVPNIPATFISEASFSNAEFSNPVFTCVGYQIGVRAFSTSNISTCKVSGEYTFVLHQAFLNCIAMKTFDMMGGEISATSFAGCSALDTVIIRGENVATLQGPAFAGTPIGTGAGYIYVPDTLVEEYKTTTNWIAYASQIKGLSELPVEASA